MNVILDIVGVSDQLTFADIKDIASKTVGMFADETFDELYMYYNHYVSAIQQDVTEKKLLPITDITASKNLHPTSLILPLKKFLKYCCLNMLKA